MQKRFGKWDIDTEMHESLHPEFGEFVDEELEILLCIIGAGGNESELRNIGAGQLQGAEVEKTILRFSTSRLEN